jgi:KDO2-lipid IV(A) lauroyltransferase
LKNDIIYYCAIVLMHLFNILPRKLALMLAGVIGEIWYILSSKDKETAHSQMAFALNLKGNELKAYARACFEMMAKNLIDVIRMKGWSREFLGSIVDVDGFENLDRAYRRAKGVIALTGHIGNFELMAAWVAGYKGYKTSVIGRKLYDERFDRTLVEQRKSFNIHNIPTDSSVKAIMKALREGHALGVLLDQDSHRVRGYFIDFFGKKALTAAGPMYIARKMGVPVVPLAICHKYDDRYYMKILPPLELEWTDNKEQDIINALQKCNKAIEELIRYDPTQWVWIHKRWRTKLPEEIEKSA